MGRIDALDGLRGLCLLLMTLTHLSFAGDFLLGYLHPRHVGFADSAHAFIFLSGLLVGTTGMRQHARGGDGPAQAARRCRRRALELYGCHLGLLLVIVATSRLLPGAQSSWSGWLEHLFEGGPAYAAATATLLYQPAFLDILPQYVLYLLAAPVLVRLVAAGRARLVLAGSLLLWLAAQAGLRPWAVALVEQFLSAGGTEVVLRGVFNPLGWQLAFNAGLLLGALLERGYLRPERLFPRHGGAPLRLALGTVSGLAAMRLAWDAGLLGDQLEALVSTLASKQDLGPLAVLSFAAWAYLTGWALVAAPQAAHAGLRAAGRAFRAAVDHPWLAALGRRSLPVFALHVLLCYGARYAYDRLGGIPDPWFSLAAVGVLAALYLPVLLPTGRRRPTATPAAVARPS